MRIYAFNGHFNAIKSMGFRGFEFALNGMACGRLAKRIGSHCNFDGGHIVMAIGRYMVRIKEWYMRDGVVQAVTMCYKPGNKSRAG